MRRRDFIMGFSGAALPLVARAAGNAAACDWLFQQPLVGIRRPYPRAVLKGIGRRRLCRRAQCCDRISLFGGRDDRLPALAAELVGRQVVMLVATDRPSALAAKAASATIPIVFTSGVDPVQLGLVASFNRPGGNATGVSLFTTELGPKRLGLVRELLAKSGTIAFVVNPYSSFTPSQVKEMQAAAQAVGQPLLVVEAGTEEQVDRAFAMMAERNVAAIVYAANLFFQVVGDRLVALAARYRIPSLYEWREFVTAGGLMSYSTDRNEVGQSAGNYAARVLKGERHLICRLYSRRASSSSSI